LSEVAPPRARVVRWSAWAPGRETQADWEAWARAPEPLPFEGQAEARFLPPLLRRRCTPLTRIVLSAAFDCLPEAERGAVRTVFASRHGSLNESIDLLESIARGERISPAKFSHTVHNAQAGLYCIATGNCRSSSSLAARADTFSCGYLEALAQLEREPERPVLYVIGDVPLAPTFAGLLPEPPAAYALALLLRRGGAEGSPLMFGLDEEEAAAERAWPDALEFLRWLLGEEPTLSLGRFRWTRRKEADERSASAQ
jgi:hypothetical protein